MVTTSTAITLARSAVAPPPLRPVRVRPVRSRLTGPAGVVALVSGGERPGTAVAPLGHASVRYHTLGSGGPQHRPAVDQPHGAAHADWSPDGTTLLYFEQEGQTFATGQEIARTFGFVFDGTQYASVRLDGGDPDVPLPIYDHPDAASLPLPASASAADCVHYLHKYARFCGAPGDAREAAGLGATVMVVSVACEDEGASFVRPGAGPSLDDFDDLAEGYPPTYAVAGVVGGPLHKPGVFP